MSHAQKAKLFLDDKEHSKWHDKALWFVRAKRDNATKSLDEWEELRKAASNIKQHTITHLDHYLELFEQKAIENGIEVHWASDAKEHNEIVLEILQQNSATKVVKSKSMLTEECHLNPYLSAHGVEVVDTDLGERIVQLNNEPPSHIVLPAIHLKKEQVGKIFEKHLHTQKDNSDPTYLTQQAREHLRQKFLSADAAITGVNFAVAQEGCVVVCTNEGNADLGTSLCDLHIASMGIEKIVPKLEHLGVFTRMLARSATGQPITTYTTHFKKPKPNGKMHIIIVDNGRSKIIGLKEFEKSLHCIRCGACMNTCPIYRRSGGHSYSYTIPGPIGANLSNARDIKKYGELAFASTLCGSCTNVCPVQIDLHHQLLAYRKEYVAKGYQSKKKTAIFFVMRVIFSSAFLTDFSFKIAKIATKVLPRSILYSKYNIWGQSRENPTFAPKSFKQIYKERS
jgi:L-lactate dehydrogenase complex protein LldF